VLWEMRWWLRLGKGAEAPSPPNRTCGSPASGSPVGGCPHREEPAARRAAVMVNSPWAVK
jgi:hypothetical protein